MFPNFPWSKSSPPKDLPIVAWRGEIGAVKGLLMRGADINEQDNSGNTALIWAAFKGYTEIARLLAEKGAALDKKDSSGKTALEYAKLQGHDDIVRILQDAEKAKANIPKGLPRAAAGGKTDLVKKMLEQGADINEMDENKNTALIWAAFNGRTEIVRLLVEKGADLDNKDNYGRTALGWAKIHKDEKIIRILKEAPKLRKKLAEEKVRTEAEIKKQELLREKETDAARVSQQPQWAGKLTGDALLALVQEGDIRQARAFFDRAFWENRRVQPEWSHLKQALLKEDKSMVRLLINWGATATDQDMSEVAGLNKYPQYVRILRRCGVQVAVPAATEGAGDYPAAAPVQAEVGDVMPDGTIYAGISPDTNKPMYAAPVDASIRLDFGRAAEYAGKLQVGDKKDFRLPTIRELGVLFQNREKGALKGTFNLTGSYWSGSRQHAGSSWCVGFESATAGVVGNMVNELSVRGVRG